MLDVQSGSGYCVCVTESHVLVGCVEGIIRVFDPVTLKYVISLPRPHSLGVNLLSAKYGNHVMEGIGFIVIFRYLSTLSCDEGRHPDTVAMAYSSTSNKVYMYMYIKYVHIYTDYSPQ